MRFVRICVFKLGAQGRNVGPHAAASPVPAPLPCPSPPCALLAFTNFSASCCPFFVEFFLWLFEINKVYL